MSKAHDAVSDAAADLYRMPPEDFIASRDERVKALRKDGDANAAKQVAALRKPTVGAWLVNLLVADEPELAEQVTALADQLRTAQEQLVGEDLRALGRQRQELVAGLVSRARKLGRDAGRKVTGNVLDTEVESSLRAALADPDVAREVLSGRLTHAAEFTGFGPATSTPGAPSFHDREGIPHRKATDPPHDHGKGGVAAGSKKTKPAKKAATKETAADRRRAEQRARTREQALTKLAEAEQTLAAARAEQADAKADAAAVAEHQAAAQDTADDLRRQLKRADAEQDRVKVEAEQATWRARRAAAALKAAQASVGRATDRLERLDRADR